MCWLLVGLAAAAVAGGKMEVIQGTTGSRSDTLEVRAGGLVVREGEPGAAFGNVRVGEADRQWAYFVVFKHGMGCDGRLEWAEETAADATTGRGKQMLAIDGRTLHLDYRVEVAAKGLKETIRLNDRPVDLARGRVFLVDLTVHPPTWEQRQLALPDTVSRAATRKEAVETVQQVFASFRRKDRKMTTFLESARR